ncbi:magnesium/cobalt transporter CorA [Roseiconus nitratireducens]|uniref:magnesium/cobalt transporter CorA n=1 Tax=Roseiconus nitratireducens TaxID=2605748 RepID=UPI001375DBB8|nr:magnesium/cobalt transporter CorA [Roseiconus nitratireducens]
MTRHRNRRGRRATPRVTKRNPPGSPPGTLHSAPGSSAPSFHLIRYCEDELREHRTSSVQDLASKIDDCQVHWINVSGLGDTEQLEKLQELFGLHSLAFEDAVNHHQRPKVEVYDDHLFVVIWMISRPDGGSIRYDQLSLFLGSNFVMTLQEQTLDCLDPVRERLRRNRGSIRASGSDFLAYALIDTVIDAYFPIVDAFGEQIDELDELITGPRSVPVMGHVHEMRGDLMNLRRAIRPLRDSLVHLMPDPHSLIKRETQFYIRDCYDHTVQLMDLLDTYREMASDLRDYYMSTVSNRMNEIMKVLTIIATIFIPLSFVAGVYGMNFNTNKPGNMPELNWPYGYLFAWLVMLLLASGLIWFIWRKGWFADDLAEDHDNGSAE